MASFSGDPEGLLRPGTLQSGFWGFLVSVYFGQLPPVKGFRISLSYDPALPVSSSSALFF